MELSHAGKCMAYLQIILGSVASNANLALDILCQLHLWHLQLWSCIEISPHTIILVGNLTVFQMQCGQDFTPLFLLTV